MVAPLNTNNIAFILYIIALLVPTIIQIYFSYEAWTILLITMKILVEYFNFFNIFTLDYAVE